MTDRPERREAARFCVNLVGEVEDMSDGEYVLYEDYDAIARENEELDRRLSLAEAEFSGGPSVHECIQTLKAERDRLQARVEELIASHARTAERYSKLVEEAERAEAKLERVREALEGEGYTDGMIAQSIAVRAALADEENSGDVTHHSPDAEDMVRDDYDAEA